MEDEYLTYLSHELNGCSSSEYILSDDPKAEKVAEEMRKEFILHVSLSLGLQQHGCKELSLRVRVDAQRKQQLAISILTQACSRQR